MSSSLRPWACLQESINYLFQWVTTGIFYANIISINDSVFLVNDNVFNPLRAFVSFINLDLGIETFFYDGMVGYARMFLQLFFPLYLIVIVDFPLEYCDGHIVDLFLYSHIISVILNRYPQNCINSLVLLFYNYRIPNGHWQLAWSIGASVPLFGLKFTNCS